MTGKYTPVPLGEGPIAIGREGGSGKIRNEKIIYQDS